ncbi:MAG: DUF4912 domain-containing protein [Spirochaetales bacterium]|nr:DUF4912 domain-containing protein [Spirochaetales bacterium]
MIRKRLQLFSLEVLASIAREKGISFDPGTEKDEIIELMLEAFEDEQIEKEIDNNESMRVKNLKYQVLEDEELLSDIDEVYPIAETYNENRIVLLLRDPSWAFAYWDLKTSVIQEIHDSRPTGKLFLRVYEIQGEKVDSKQIKDFFDIPLTVKDASWYINLPQTGVNYCIDLIVLYRTGEKTLARSNVISSPMVEFDTERKDDLFYQPDLAAFDKLKRENEIPQRIISVLDNQCIN